MKREMLIEAMAKHMREEWRDRNDMRAGTLPWDEIEEEERESCLAEAAAALDAIESAGVVLVPRDAMTNRFVSPFAKDATQ